MPQEFLDILVAEVPKTKVADNPLANDPLLGHELRSPEDDDPDMGTVLSVVLKKLVGAKRIGFDTTRSSGEAQRAR